MKIQDLFERNIRRPINGVVKADQLDASSIWQELDEFVLTRELIRHMNELVSVLLSAIDPGNGSASPVADKNGIWVSGFFGCGKSHFIKVLSYLLENASHEYEGQQKRAVDFFKDKIDDPLLYADLKKIVATSTDTILFNIDSKADHRGGRDALLQVFLKVLNERQGYSGDYPHIAHMERHLEEKGKLATFHAAFERAAGASWVQERDAWEFHRDEVKSALRETLDQSEGSVEAWVEGAQANFSLTVENFAKWVKRYLDGRGPQQRIMFLVDEVGQFIGNDTHLMLNLQTITEQLGTICKGRAWVVVTSQEDLDAVLGDLKSRKQHDFSKIQGRFKTRLSLSSANVDEVIKRRLLDKKDAAQGPLAAAYEGKHDILKNQLSFVHTGMSFKSYTDGEDFAACYPFAAYQFSLVQKVFESIRKAGATGLHLSQGERSTLDAFQGAAMELGERPIGALVPFYYFYPAVEGFLDTAVKRTIDKAGESHVLQAFDATLLKVLFLIRYIDELPGSVDNLVTLCIAEIDGDKLRLRKQVEASLARLEKETLISRNGDLYFFLTNEERDIGCEIKNTSVPSGAEERELGKLLFEDLLGEVRKHTYKLTGRDFSFTRLCDNHPVGNRIEGSLEVAFVSPLGDMYEEFSSDETCVLHTSLEEGRLLIRLPNDALLGTELCAYLQTEVYVKRKQTGSLPENTKRILRERSDDNRERRKRLLAQLGRMLAAASYFACATTLDIQQGGPKEALGEALEYLIRNAYPKMGYIDTLHPNPKQEIQSTLRANDVEQVHLAIDSAGANPEALADLREYIRLCGLTSKQLVLSDLIERRYGHRPYGWPELELLVLVARLAVLKEISLIDSNTKTPIALDQAYDLLTSSTKQRRVLIVQRESAGGELIKHSQTLAKALFGKQGSSSEEELFTSIHASLRQWHDDLSGYEPLAQTRNYPGILEIQASLGNLRKFVEERDSLKLLRRFVENKSELLDLSEDLLDLQEFYRNQKTSWERLREAARCFEPNQMQLEIDEKAAPAWARMLEILAHVRPYGMLKEAAGLIDRVKSVNDALVAASRAQAVPEIQGLLDGVQKDLQRRPASAAPQGTATSKLQHLLKTAETSRSIAHIAQARDAAEAAFEQAMNALEATAFASEPAGPVPGLKRRRTIGVKQLWSGGYIETSEQMEQFLAQVRSALEAALAADERIQLK